MGEVTKYTVSDKWLVQMAENENYKNNIHYINKGRTNPKNARYGSEYNILTFCFLYQKKLTPRSRVLLDMLTVTQLLNKLPTFYGTRRFITVFTRAHPEPDESSPYVPSYFPKIHSNIILPHTPKGLSYQCQYS